MDIQYNNVSHLSKIRYFVFLSVLHLTIFYYFKAKRIITVQYTVIVYF